MIKLDDIRLDGGTQCRVTLDQGQIYDYVDKMKDGAEFPSIEAVYDGSTYWLTDGFHRYHAMKILGLKEAKVKWKTGTQQDAVLEALKANSTHGLTLSNADKRHKVEMALAIPGFDQKSNYEIAKLCHLSQPFVAAVRDPAVKEKQKINSEKHALKKAQETTQREGNTKLISIGSEEPPEIASGEVPSEEELAEAEAIERANFEAMFEIIESDDRLAKAYEEIKRLNQRVANLENRMAGLMNEKNEAIKQAKLYQNQLDKLRKQK